jgi:hypothetical protein
MAFNPKYYFDEAKYQVLRTFRMVQGKTLHIGLRTAMGGGAASVANDLAHPVREAVNVAHPTITGTAATQASLSTGEIILSSTGGLLSIGVGAGVNCYLNHLEHKHNQKQLCTLYRPQLAALTGKELSQIGVEDLQSVAADNPTLQNELIRNDHKRNIKNVAGIVSTAVAFTAVFAAIAFFPPLAGLAAAAATGGLFSGAGLLFAGVAGVLGFGAVHYSRKSAIAIGNRVMGLDEPSVADKIETLDKMHRKEVTIRPEQVMDIFVSANPSLSADIEGRYGKKFEDMMVNEKRSVTAEYADALNAPQIAKAINEGRLNAAEMTFLAHGQTSGVYPDEPWRERVVERTKETIGEWREDAIGKYQQWKQERAQSRMQGDVAKAIEESRPQQEVQRTGWRDMITSQRNAAKIAEGQSRA